MLFVVCKRGFSRQRRGVNQVVIRVFLAILALILAIIFAFFPRLKSAGRWLIVLRFFLGLGLIIGLLEYNIHEAGWVQSLSIQNQQLWVGKQLQGRAGTMPVWAAFEPKAGSLQKAPEEWPALSLRPTYTSTAWQITKTLKTRLKTYQEESWVEIGPELVQPDLLYVDQQQAVVSSFTKVNAPETVYLFAIDRQGKLLWKKDAEQLSLSFGRARRALMTPDGLYVAYEGVPKVRTRVDRLLYNQYAVILKLAPKTGELVWQSKF